jgi:hypothetical protein
VAASRPPRDVQTFRPFLYHVFFIRGQVILEGLNYDPREHPKHEVEYSLRVWLAGWRLVRTMRASIPHPGASVGQVQFGGGAELSIRHGIPVESHWKEKFMDTGLVTCTTFTRDGQVCPNYTSVIPTQKATDLHAAGARAHGWEP